MKRKIIAMILTLAMVASLTTALAQSESDAKHSSTSSGYISKWDEVDIHSFTVPYTGNVTVRVSAERNHSTGMGYQFVLYSDNKSYVTKKIYLKTSSQEFASEVLPAGTYYISVKYGASSLTFQSAYKDTKYFIDWKFSCSHKNRTSTELTAATCSEEGSVEVRCDDCKEVVTTKATDKLPHTPTGEWIITRETTCSEVGRRIQKCSVCGEDALVEEIEKLSHTAEWKTTKEATCSSEGQQESVCSVCKQVVDTKRIPTLPHSYGGWQTEDEGTCREVGEQSRICSVCNYKDTKSGERGEHKYGEWSTERKATCTEQGFRVRICKLCNNEDRETVPKLEHRYGSWTITHEATCKDNGIRNRICELCRKKEEQSTDKLAHTFYNEVVASGGGKETYLPICSVCGTSGSSVGITEEKKDENKKEVTVTKANSSTPTVIVIIMPAFQDVGGGSWYQSAVAYAYNLGLMVMSTEQSSKACDY